MGSGGSRGLQNRWPRAARWQVRFLPLPLPMKTNERLSRLPHTERLLSDARIAFYHALLSRPLVAKTVSGVLAEERERALGDESYLPEPERCVMLALDALGRLDRKRFKPVLNGTGIILHTNLGRSPLPALAWDGARAANLGYSPVELDLDNGQRGARGGLVPELAAALAGTEDALVVNNNAAAVLLTLSALAAGRDVIVARGEQVQIGGGFRVPDIMALAGAKFKEVGTTNIVHASDYARAVGPDSACALLVHSSNFAIRGFASRPRPAEVVQALPPGLPVYADQGSGCLDENIPGETPLSSYVKAGCALVSFSADKLLGGPQAGIIAGRADLLAKLRNHPLYRAFRPGKTIYSLLERVLVARLNGEPGPAGRARSRELGELQSLAHDVLALLPDDSATLVTSLAASGGGSGPDETFPSVALELGGRYKADTLSAALRQAPLPLLGRIQDDRVRLDFAALADEPADQIASTIRWAFDRCSLPSTAGAIGDAQG